ncbi:hypothetical protein BO79DRAFT_67868 [Aspergillus costaricaensis CBS 115574]|uniref:Uncharacterized protein n=1 Tax=Aspergillus costaricaensis CBS 115574 TaxID=1448317 RepID=A0ACD1I190_9EURO|nr:hypothetical protein BO79DRAFT_67868 [Aspergillus costaricaensis CBS 115574]RAK83531.1 hypothetical protein BO79DRAFT_67868 [Aspergillus costaricaensis CBS 115574]
MGRSMHISLIWLFSFTLSISLNFLLPHSRLLLNLLFLLSSDIYIPRICDKPIWQLNLHPLHFQSSPCLGQCATTVHSYHHHLFIFKKRGDLPLQFSTLLSPPCSLAPTLRDLVRVFFLLY